MVRKVFVIIVALLALFGVSFAQNDFESYGDWLKLARKGDPHAQAMVAYYLKEGIGGEKDLYNATGWAMKSADSGNGLAYWLLAQMHIGRKGKMEFLESALSCNYPLAAPLLARLYYFGSDYFNIQQDKYRVQIKNYNVKLDKLNTKWNDQINEKAFGLFELAAKSGSSEDAAFLGNYYLKEVGDTSKAFEFYTLASENGDAESMSILAYMLYYGYGTKKDESASFKWLQEAAKKGSLTGLEGYADCCRIGVGTPIDEEEAFNTYSSIDKPSTRVQYILGYYLMTRIDGIREYSKSLLWNSSTLGYSYSQAVIGIAYYEGKDPFGKDIDQALPYLENAYDNSDFEYLPPEIKQKVYRYLSYYYRYGRGVVENIQLAEELFEKDERLQTDVDNNNSPFAFVGMRSFDDIVNSYTPKLSPASSILNQTVFDYPSVSADVSTKQKLGDNARFLIQQGTKVQELKKQDIQPE